MTMSSRELALQACRLIQDKGGLDLTLLELAPEDALCDFVILATGRSDRQVDGIVDEVLHYCKAHGIPHFPVEGAGGWQLLDCHEVVIHAMGAELRDFYRLERLWPQATRVEIPGETAALPAGEEPLGQG